MERMLGILWVFASIIADGRSMVMVIAHMNIVSVVIVYTGLRRISFFWGSVGCFYIFVKNSHSAVNAFKKIDKVDLSW